MKRPTKIQTENTEKTTIIQAQWDNAWGQFATTARLTQPDEIPTGFKTVLQLIQEFHKGKSAVLLSLKRGIANGTMEMKIFRTKRSDGITANIPHYRPIIKGE